MARSSARTKATAASQGEEEEQVDPPGPVAGGLAQDDGEGERPESQRPRARSPGMSNRARTGSELSGSTMSGTGEGEQPEEDVEPEDGPPRPAEDQQAADERAERQPEAGHGRPDAEGTGPLARSG